MGPAEHALELHLVQPLLRRRQLLRRLGQLAGIFHLLHELADHLGVVEVAADLSEDVQLALDLVALLQQLLGRLLVVPEGRLPGEVIQLGEALALVIPVKDTSGARGADRADR